MGQIVVDSVKIPTNQVCDGVMVSLSSRHAFLAGRQHTKTPTYKASRRVAESSFRDRLLIPLPEHRSDISTYMYIYVYIHTCMYTHMYMYMYTYMYIYTYMHIYVYHIRRALKNILSAGPEGVIVDEDLALFSSWLRDDNEDTGGYECNRVYMYVCNPRVLLIYLMIL